MKRSNVYSEDIYRYGIENGTNIFIEYKQADEERQKELEDWLFNLVRTKNIFPVTILGDEEEKKVLLTISNTDSHSVYDAEKGEYGKFIVGVSFLNRFFPEIFNVRKKGTKYSMMDAFENDTLLRRAIKKTLAYSRDEMDIYRWLFLIQGVGYCSNFKPIVAKAIYEIWGSEKNCKVLDTSAGYGGRLLGAHFATNVSEYIGIDPNTKDSCDGLIDYLSKEFPISKTEKVYKMGSEDFTKDKFPEYVNHFDLYFTSPPYFDTEQYSEDDSQSYKKFPTYKGWLDGFYKNTIYNACDMLKDDGIFIINIFEKIPKIKDITKLYLADCGWYIIKSDKYILSATPGTWKDEDGNIMTTSKNSTENSEPVWYARHYSYLYENKIIDKDTYESYEKRAIR